MLKTIKSIYHKLIGMGNESAHARPDEYGTGRDGTTTGHVVNESPPSTSEQAEPGHPERLSMPSSGDPRDFQPPGSKGGE